MSNNPYMDAFVHWFREQDDDPGVNVELVAALALIVEIQTLNSTLKELTYEDEWGGEYLRVRLDSTDRGTLGADGT